MTNTVKKGANNLNNKEKGKIEELAFLIAQLSEQEQAKIYYMLKGYEIFGKPITADKH